MAAPTSLGAALWQSICSVSPQNEAAFMTGGMALAQIVGYWFPCLVLTLIWKLKLFQSFRILPHDKSAPAELVKENIIKSVVNTFVINPVLTYFFLWRLCQGNVFTDPPRVSTFIWQISFFFILNDAYFYWAHRFAHDSMLYRAVHKLHHRFTYTVGWAASGNATLAEDVLINMASTIGPIAVLAYCSAPVHGSVYITYFTVRYWETVEGHSGYSNPFSLWHYLRSNDFHAYHHRYYNRGNFGIFPWWDALCGTDKHYRKDRKEDAKSFWQ